MNGKEDEVQHVHLAVRERPASSLLQVASSSNRGWFCHSFLERAVRYSDWLMVIRTVEQVRKSHHPCREWVPGII